VKTGRVSTTNTQYYTLWFCYKISGVGRTLCVLCEVPLTRFQLLLEGLDENIRHKVIVIVSVLPHPYAILHVYRCTVVHVYIYYACFEDFVVYKCNDGFSGYSRTRAINQGSNEKYWGVIVFGKPLICTRGACGSVLFTLPLNSSGYVEKVKQLTYFMASFFQLSYFSSRRY